MNHTSKEVKEVPCIRCNAKPSEPCKTGAAVLMVGYHRERVELRRRMPLLPPELDATDKALICYFAYVHLCDSVSTKSEELLGKKLTSADIQRFFAAKAIENLKKEGLMK